MAKNNAVTHFFLKGMSADKTPNAESKETYEYGLNGRIYSENGIINYTSIDGTIKVFENENIVKILGWSAFFDELILFVKSNEKISGSNQEIIGYETVEKLISDSYSLSSTGNATELKLKERIRKISYEIPIYSTNEEDITVNNPISCTDEFNESIDYSDYYKEVISQGNIQFCQLKDEPTYENNKEYIDAIISIKKDAQGNFKDEVIWKGLLNWDINGKIITHNVVENSYYKRIYFTDDQTPFKAINLKDKKLKFRNEEELNSFQKSVLLQPIISSIGDNGIIKSGMCLYAYRLITENGQITSFSSFSEEVYIIPSNEGPQFEGGKISQVTNKSVNVRLNLEGHKFFKYVELIVIEFEALGAPTSIRQIGKKEVSPVVNFTHYGNEPEFNQNLPLSEVLKRNANWTYCSDIDSKSNKLVAAGLRNEPINSELQTMRYDFMLHGWDADGHSHNCLINPNPEKYRYINANTHPDYEMYYINKRIYSSIKIFGNYTVRFENKSTGLYLEKSFINDSKRYNECIEDIADWLREVVSEELYPNLKVEKTSGFLILSMIDEPNSIKIPNYRLSFNTEQVIQDFDDQIVFNDLENFGAMVFGNQSLGFNKGNGIRITFRTEEEEVLTKATGPYKTSKPLLNLSTPSMRKGMMKGEIYRLGILPYDKQGNELFNIPIGDIQIPSLGDSIKYIDDNGMPIIKSEVYCNSFVKDNRMFIQRIVMNVEIRISCELQEIMSMYKIVYVERTGLNKTILAQGISAPLERVQTFERTEFNNIKEQVVNKWCLPPQGGPLYDYLGLKLWDEKPNGPFDKSGEERVMTNRKLFYFDSPDFIYNRENPELAKNCSIHRVGRLNIEYDKYLKNYFDITMNDQSEAPEPYPMFSRKIYKDQLYGDENRKPMFSSVSVFLERRADNDYLEVEHSEELSLGEIIPGTSFNEGYEISNNALCLQFPSWYYSIYGRKEGWCGKKDATSKVFQTSHYSPGRKTLIIKTKNNCFSEEFINQIPQQVVFMDLDANGPGYMCKGYDTHGLFNLSMNNKENVYGGRSERDLTENIYISLSSTIPVHKISNSTQQFQVQGDVYTTLFPRNKNMYNTDNVRVKFDVSNGGNCSDILDNKGIEKNGAWSYVVALETIVEPKLDYTNTFYKQTENINFTKAEVEAINEAYFQTNNIKQYIPQPYDFKDEPSMDNIIAVSETKLNGAYIDAYVDFRVNNFYEVEREKGKVYNLVSDLNNIYAIQEYQTSRLFLDENTMMNTSNGDVSIQQGTGQGISNHEVISDFGTSIRRSVVSSIPSSEIIQGFTFFDEKKKEFVRTNKPLFFMNELHLDFMNRYPNEIVDVEGWYDQKFKETNMRLRFDDGKGITISYNEKLEAFNGYMNYNEDLYIAWEQDLLTPKNSNGMTPFLYQLNKGNPMNILDNQYNMIIKVTTATDGVETLLFNDFRGVLNIDYPIKQFRLKSNYSGTRVINGTHHRYFIKEATHSVPLKNRNDRADFRGNWMEMEVEIESKNNQKVSVYSFTNFVRNSYQ